MQGDRGVPGLLVFKECQSQDAVIIVSVSDYYALETLMSVCHMSYVICHMSYVRGHGQASLLQGVPKKSVICV